MRSSVFFLPISNWQYSLRLRGSHVSSTPEPLARDKLQVPCTSVTLVLMLDFARIIQWA